MGRKQAQVSVWLEFAPKGRLKTYSSVQLEIKSGNQKVVSARLAPSKQTPDLVTYCFSTTPELLRKSALTVFYRIEGGYPPFDGFRFDIGNFIEPAKGA